MAAVVICTIFVKNLLVQKKFVTLSHLIDQVVKGGIGIVERRSLFFIGHVMYSGRYPFSVPVIPVHFFVGKTDYLVRS